MKSVLINYEELGEGYSILAEKPNKLSIALLATVIGCLFIFFIWITLFKIDVVVKCEAEVQNRRQAESICTTVSGTISDMRVVNGQYVNKGDEICYVQIENAQELMEKYTDAARDAEQRIEIMDAYFCMLDGDEDKLNICTDNPYYCEFDNRRRLILQLEAQTEQKEVNTKKYFDETEQVDINIVQKYENEILQLESAKECIRTRNNTFATNDKYYLQIEKYLIDYNAIVSKYDAMISEHGDSDSLTREKEAELQKREIEELSFFEQQESDIRLRIDEKNNAIRTNQAEKNMSIENETTSSEKIILEEKNVMAREMITWKEKLKESQNAISELQNELNSATICASSSGRVYVSDGVCDGKYVGEGVELGKLFPKEQDEYYVVSYVSDNDIGYIKSGQNVRIELSAYSTKNNNQFIGTVESVSDTPIYRAEQAYFEVKVCLSPETLRQRNSVVLRNGMQGEARIIVKRETIIDVLKDYVKGEIEY